MAESGGEFYDRQEVRRPAEREQAIFHALPGLIRHALDNAPAFVRHLGDVDPDAIVDRAALAKLPVLRKSQLHSLQQAALPFGGFNATPPSRLVRIFASPGPIYDPEGPRLDYWRFARALFAAGFRSGDLIHNTFSYHLTPAGSMVEGGARALGCPVIPGGTSQTELQARVIHDLKPRGYVGTPSFLLVLLEKARELGYSTASITKALVSGEAFPASLRERLRREFGIDAYQCYATADVGLIAYETSAREGLVVDEAVILEIVRPGTGDPVPEGEIGEVVVTVFNPDYPLIRFATGDLSAVLPGQSPCGRTNMRIKGWLGRVDQGVKVRGMFVYPHQIGEALKRFDMVGRARLEVSREEERDRMVLRCEVAGAPSGLEQALAEAVRAATGLRAEIELVPPGTLPEDGKVIDDRRPSP
ncbi:MAG: AMP-binding protein [Geminicoccaceae bacterium]|nr:AMP-binding protein [Geminicoccaceae bacterium]